MTEPEPSAARRIRWRGRLTAAAVLLAAAALVNVTVASWCDWRLHTQRQVLRMLTADEAIQHGWSGRLRADRPMEVRGVWHVSSAGTRSFWAFLHDGEGMRIVVDDAGRPSLIIESAGLRGPWAWLLEHQVGWPLPSFAGRGSASLHAEHATAVLHSLRHHDGERRLSRITLSPRPPLDVEEWDSRKVFAPFTAASRWWPLPVRPVWPGFAMNTLLYAAALWLLAWLLITPAQVMQHRRRNRAGLCRRCGYDLRGGPHGRCPECGAECASPC